MTNAIGKLDNRILTDHGLNLPPDITEDQFFEVGKVLGNIEKGMQWAVGDWYNSIPQKNNQYSGEEGKRAACERVGLNYRTAESYAAVCAVFSFPTRIGVLSFNHHRMLTLSDLTNEQRQSLLKSAAEGDGEGKPWSSKRLVEERDKVLGTWEEPVEIDSADAIVGFVEQSLPNIPEKYRKQVDRAVRSAAMKLASDFESQVKAEVSRRLKQDKERLKLLEEKAQAEFDSAIKLKRGIKAFMSEQDFKLIRSLLHPDKHGGEPRYGRAFDIFNRLAETTAELKLVK